MSSVWQAYKLQELDNRLKEIEEEIETLDSGQSFETTVNEAEERLNQTKEERKKLQSKLKQKDIQVQGIVENKKQLEKKLYGGKVNNPKELGSLQDDIQSTKKQQDKIEEEMLSLMEEIEKVESSISIQEKEIEGAGKTLESVRSQYDTNLQNLKLEGEDGRNRREKIVASLEPKFYESYENLKKIRDEVAVAKVIKGNCGGCFMNVPDSVIRKVLSGYPETCPQCGRYLYVEKEEK